MNFCNSFCLNNQYSTTRIVTKEQPRIENDPSSKLQTLLLFPANSNRQGEGGLRTKEYFKRSFNDKPLVTIITIVYNRREYIAQTIESVLVQSYSNVEYVIIDGGSTDGTLDIIKKYEHAIDYWVSEPDSGISDAFNKGVIASTGEWLNFMNCGDKFTSTDIVQVFSKNIDEKVDLIFGKSNVIDNQGEIIITTGKIFDKKMFSRRMTIPHQSAFHNKRYFQQYGLFDKSLKVGMVYELLLRKQPLTTVFIDETISNMLVAGVNETEDYLRLREAKMIKKRHCSNVRDLAVVEFDYCRALVRALVKRALNRIGLRSVTRKIRQIENRLR